MRQKFAKCGCCGKRGAYRCWSSCGDVEGWEVRCRYCKERRWETEDWDHSLEVLAARLVPMRRGQTGEGQAR